MKQSIKKCFIGATIASAVAIPAISAVVLMNQNNQVIMTTYSNEELKTDIKDSSTTSIVNESEIKENKIDTSLLVSLSVLGGVALIGGLALLLTRYIIKQKASKIKIHNEY